jgi:N utilization substance protein A
MNTGVLEALRRIAREKQLENELLIEALEAGLMSAARKKFGPEAEIEVIVDGESDTLAVYLNRTVVDMPDDLTTEIDVEEAEEIDPAAQIGDVIKTEISLDEFGRNAIQAAKQIVVQRVREAEREQIYEEFQDRIGDIVTGDVQQIERAGIVVNLGRTEALLPTREQIRRERYRQGDRIRAYLLSVEKTTKGPQIILSRTHPNFLKKLFRMEVPEIYDSVVEIMAIAREAGGRSKVAVASHDERVDPVGACVGVKGSRIQTIVRELAGEKIDIVAWSSDPAVLVTRALNPAKVSRAIIDESERSVRVVVPDDQLSLAIGKGGQNARLAAKLSGWKIDIVGETEHTRLLEIDLSQRVEVSELPGVGEKLASELMAAGYRTVQDLEGLSSDELERVPGIGRKTAEKISIAVAAVLEVLEEEKQRLLTEMDEQEPAEPTTEESIFGGRREPDEEEPEDDLEEAGDEEWPEEDEADDEDEEEPAEAADDEAVTAESTESEDGEDEPADDAGDDDGPTDEEGASEDDEDADEEPDDAEKTPAEA